ncbi:hypothetical protein HPB48_019158 [Haemaphysalis longicornis]|uniref:Rho GTPase-activating protein pG1 and pG2 domain-containing protein n=1 Tax=Haemaphysalis longicornis TaxID=44386 RepID=A0A9J6FY60_HAELO|nr:hypothetical protein HPB48_019158 [Haemaphysalis longicornis]
MDGVIEQLLHRREAGTNCGGVLGTNDRLLHLVVLGARASAQQVAQAMRQALPQGFRLDKAHYALDVRIIGDVGRPQHWFRTEPLPHGCLCVYTSQPGLEYIRESLQKTLLANLEQEDRLPFHGLPPSWCLRARGTSCARRASTGPRACSAPSWTTAAAWTPCGWSRHCARWWTASSGRRAGFTSSRCCPRSRDPGRTCG